MSDWRWFFSWQDKMLKAISCHEKAIHFPLHLILTSCKIVHEEVAVASARGSWSLSWPMCQQPLELNFNPCLHRGYDSGAGSTHSQQSK